MTSCSAFSCQVASRQDATVEKLQEELLRWEEQYQASTAAAGPAKWRLRSAFLTGTYASLQRALQDRRSAEENARAAEADRRNRVVNCSSCTAVCLVLGVPDVESFVACPVAYHRLGHGRGFFVPAYQTSKYRQQQWCVQLEKSAAAARQDAQEAELKRQQAEQQLHSFKPQVCLLPFHHTNCCNGQRSLHMWL